MTYYNFISQKRFPHDFYVKTQDACGFS